jgi:hypothetical protein
MAQQFSAGEARRTRRLHAAIARDFSLLVTKALVTIEGA